jgi:chemotaxis protein histidine kinase CheA
MLKLTETEEIFDIFDSIKNQIHMMIIKGITNTTDSLKKLQDLRSKVTEMHLNVLVDLLDTLITHLQNLSEGINPEIKHTLSKTILDIITINRIFEQAMTVDILKAQYFKSSELENIES